MPLMPPSSPNRQARGQYAEHAACAFLQAQGLRLVTRNFRCKVGEIDLILQQQDWLICAEVRLRSRMDFGGAVVSVTRRKQQKIIAATQVFLQYQPRFAACAIRFDIVAVQGTPGDWRIDWLQAAFMAS